MQGVGGSCTAGIGIAEPHVDGERRRQRHPLLSVFRFCRVGRRSSRVHRCFNCIFHHVRVAKRAMAGSFARSDWAAKLKGLTKLMKPRQSLFAVVARRSHGASGVLLLVCRFPIRDLQGPRSWRRRLCVGYTRESRFFCSRKMGGSRDERLRKSGRNPVSHLLFRHCQFARNAFNQPTMIFNGQ